MTTFAGSDRLAAGAGRDTPARPAEVTALTVLICGAAACLAAGVAFPPSHQAPRALGVAMLAIAVALAAATFWLGHRVPRVALLAEAAAVAVLNSVIVANAHTPGGAVADAFAYLWMAVYVAACFPRWWAAFGVLVSAGFGAGLLVAGLPGLVAAWVVFSVTVLSAGAAVSHVSRMLLGRATTDDLTGVLNRGGLEAAARGVHRRRRAGDRADAAVVLIDIDGFKAVNDLRGHASGDRLLVEATGAWRGALRRSDILARTGGDEFVIIMPETGRDEAVVVLSRLRAAHDVPWSAGVARWAPGEALDACVARADAELYAAKAAAS